MNSDQSESETSLTLSESQTPLTPRKRKTEDSLEEFETIEQYLQTLTLEEQEEFLNEHINMNDGSSTSGLKNEDDSIPTYSRKDDLNKQTVAQGGTNLDLTNVPFKDQEKIIDDWAQSMSIVITNQKAYWAKERFLDYIAASVQGNVL